MDLVESRPLCITSSYFPCNWLKLPRVDTTLGYTGVDEKSLMQTLMTLITRQRKLTAQAFLNFIWVGWNSFDVYSLLKLHDHNSL